MIKEQDFLEQASLDALLVAFVNAKPYKNGYVIESSYRDSRYAPYLITQEIYLKNNQLMNDYFGLSFHLNKQHRHQYVIESLNDSDTFFQNIYSHILQKRVKENISDKVFEQKMLLSFFVLRGSLDIRANFYSLDLLRDIVTESYLDKLFRLLTNIRDLMQLNLNFRELQKQFVVDEKRRNTQFRVNLRYFYDTVGELVKDINIYKYDMLEKNSEVILRKNISDKNYDTFIERLFFYMKKVLNKEKMNNEIELLRKELGFVYDHSVDGKTKRNRSIVEYVKILEDDECAACKDHFPIENRSFKYRNSERYYLEVHHCISYSADNTCDQIDNLVKLCPACHRALTKNRADESYQKELINNIFKNSPKVKEFCLNFVDEDNVINFVYDRLR